jgi:guanylate kinase
MRSSKGGLFIVSAPSGAGKTTILKRLMAEMGGLALAISHTTREPRPEEKDGEDYFFVSPGEFLRMRDDGEFVEWAEVHGNYYGTSRGMLESMMSSGTDVLHDIDVQGAGQIRESGMEAVFVFIMPPSLDELEQRLRGRGGDPEEAMERRLRNAAGEVKGYLLYDYVILNDDLELALEEFKCLVTSRRLSSDAVDKDWIRKNFSIREDL